jgi:hypothetical protein
MTTANILDRVAMVNSWSPDPAHGSVDVQKNRALADLVPDLVSALTDARARLFLVRGKLAELIGQLAIADSGLPQPPGRYVGDELDESRP